MHEQKGKLQRAITHLRYSYNKIINLPLPEQLSQFDEELLETWESFAARFSRVTDIFLTKYIRTLILQDDPGFNEYRKVVK